MFTWGETSLRDALIENGDGIVTLSDLGAVGSYAKIDEDHEMSNDRGNVLKGHLLNDMKGMLTLAGLFVSFVTIVLQTLDLDVDWRGRGFDV
ncbi:hypothetical protein MtrunA17_Chr4g0023011 [Medicago truncatula]|uniref:Transmembrane protein n=1 Tax=Medicago truncatula TaxID=3880 RepID=A0A396I3M4_MEDTR|nr:hypothetical protein MtrunA17_Chr4g0023011 [Medicago truncatula]